MGSERPSVLQINTTDCRGGAGIVAWNLHQAFRRSGLESWMAVGYKFSDDPTVIPVPNRNAGHSARRALLELARRLQESHAPGRATRTICRGIKVVAQPRRTWDFLAGREDFEHPGTWNTLRSLPFSPRIIHCHNLHGHYFDLRALPRLGRRTPLVLTLHDAWLTTGHCAHSLGCERWRTGCGNCPDLRIPPRIFRDATHSNWCLKRQVYAESGRLHVAAPCRWLIERARSSMMGPFISSWRVIPNGVDRSVFRPGDRQAARNALELPQNASIVLFIPGSGKKSYWKDHETLHLAVELASEQLNERDLLCLVVGDGPGMETRGKAKLVRIPPQPPGALAGYYRAADIYFHPARADTFPNVVLESLACGTPVVASRVGGIPEQIRCVREFGRRATGLLVEPDDPRANAAAIMELLTNEAVRKALGSNAAADAQSRFSLDGQAAAYLSWYREILDTDAPATPSPGHVHQPVLGVVP